MSVLYALYWYSQLFHSIGRTSSPALSSIHNVSHNKKLKSSKKCVGVWE